MKRQKVGFVAIEGRSSIVFPTPRLLRSTRALPLSRRAVQACPAVNTFERRVIELLAPFSIQIRCQKTNKGTFEFFLIENGTRIDSELISGLVSFMPREIWRTDNVPVVQIALPHLFISDESLFLTQMPAWASPTAIEIPGNLISGRFPADLWPRSLNLAFEWRDIQRDFKMRRGQPICYLFAETSDPEAGIDLIEAEMTEKLSRYISAISDVVKYTSDSFSLFERARKIRPKLLLEEKLSE